MRGDGESYTTAEGYDVFALPAVATVDGVELHLVYAAVAHGTSLVVIQAGGQIPEAELALDVRTLIDSMVIHAPPAPNAP